MPTQVNTIVGNKINPCLNWARTCDLAILRSTVLYQLNSNANWELVTGEFDSNSHRFQFGQFKYGNNSYRG